MPLPLAAYLERAHFRCLDRELVMSKPPFEASRVGAASCEL